MEELTKNYYYPNNYFNQYNNNNFKKSSLNYSMKYNNYINPQNQILNNNANISQDAISLVQIKHDLDSMNDKLNMISNTLFKMNLFNNNEKRKINLKKSNSMNSKCIKINKKIPANIYNTKYNIKDLTMNNFEKTYSFFNNDINLVNNNDINKNFNRNNNNETFDDFNNMNNNFYSKYNSFLNKYLPNSINIGKLKKNKKIQNIKYRRNNSIIGTNTFNNKYTFDDTLNINNFILNDEFTKSNNCNINKLNDINDENGNNNISFGQYDQYFLDNLQNNNQEDKLENNSINNNLNKITYNLKNKTSIINDNQNEQIEKMCNNKNVKKKKLIFSDFNNNIEGVKTKNKNHDNLKIINQPELMLSKQTNLFNKIYNQHNKNSTKLEKNPSKDQIKINNKQINKVEKNNKIISKKENLIKSKKEIQFKPIDINKLIKNKQIKENKKKKNLSFHEEDNITIEYNKKDEITKINVFDFFGENQNFQPRNVNVIIEKLKRKKSKNKSILLNNDNKKNLIGFENKNEMKKIKKSNSGISIRSNKEEMLLNKYKLLRNKNSNSHKKNYNIKKRNKICEKFKNNPQLFYNEELCDLVIKSLDLDGDYMNKNNSKCRNKNERNNYNSINKNENMTDTYFNDEPMEFHQKIIEETE